MFWMFLANAIGMVTMFGLAFYLLLITQKGGFFGKARAKSSGFFCSFFGPAGLDRIIVRSSYPVDPWQLARKVAELCDCSLCCPAGTWLQLQLPGSGNELLFGLVPEHQFIGLGVGVGVGLRSRSRYRISFSAPASRSFLSELSQKTNIFYICKK